MKKRYKDAMELISERLKDDLVTLVMYDDESGHFESRGEIVFEWHYKEHFNLELRNWEFNVLN